MTIAETIDVPQLAMELDARMATRAADLRFVSRIPSTLKGRTVNPEPKQNPGRTFVQRTTPIFASSRGAGSTTKKPPATPLMKITIESTTKIVEVNGVNTRIWVGKSESGIPVTCFVATIAVAKEDVAQEDHLSELRAELQEHVPPPAQVEAISLRLIL